MKVLRLDDIFIGRNYARMINEAIGTNLIAYQKSTVDLDQLGVPGVIAWFVYMDGSEHGYPDDWKWVNILSPDGKTIREYNISPDKNRLKNRQNSEGYFPYRLCFHLDPNGTDKNNWCKFVGAFRFSRFLRSDLSAVEYVKVLDEFKIGSRGDGYNAKLNTKKDFMIEVDPFKVPIEKMNFSDGVRRLLKSGGIVCARDLLELGIDINGETAMEIRNKLYEYFH